MNKINTQRDARRLSKSVYGLGTLKNKRKSEYQKHGLYNVEMLPSFFFLSEEFCLYLHQPYNPE